MARTMFASLALAAAGLTLASCASDKKTSEPTPIAAPLTYEDSATVATTAKVEAVDQASRRITLRDSTGRSARYVVGQQVQRLNEVQVGDTVKATYSVSLEAELRPPTVEEVANPISITEVTSRAPQGSEPAGSVHRRVRVVSTVEAVNLGKMQVTLKGPMGDLATVRARKQENIKQLHVGDTIVITYVETAVVALDKR